MAAPRTLTLFVTALLSTSATAELEADLFPMPPNSFEASAKDRISDVSAALRLYGFDLPDGSEATYQGPRRLLYLKSTRKDINRLTRALEDSTSDAQPAEAFQLRVTTTCHALFVAPDDITAIDGFRPTPEGIKAWPAEKRSVLDRRSLTTRSGQRGKVETQREADPDADAGEDFPNPDPAPIATLEVDPVIGADNVTIELNLAYEITQPLKGDDARARHGAITTAVILNTGSTMMFELGYLDAPQPHLLVLAVSAESLTKKAEPVRAAPATRRAFPEDYFMPVDQ